MRRLVLLFLLPLALSCSSAESAYEARNVLRVSDGKRITFNEMIAEVKKVNVVFVGEIHDDEDNHADQLEVMKALHESDVPLAVGLEMFRADSQNVLDSWVKGKLSMERFLPSYFDNWRMPWSYYRDIFWYARDHDIPLVGLNISDQISRKVAKQGFASLTKEERKQLPAGISCNVDPKYMEFIRRAYAGHGGHDREFVNFCEAQMVWDKSMAWHLIDYLRKNPGKTIVVLAGVGHAWKRGIPEQVGMESRISSRVILPLIPDQIEQRTVTTRDADYVLLE